MTAEEIKQYASTKSVLIIGDVMMDRYVIGRVDRMSPEADVPVIFHQKTEEKLGGAANVAKNFKALGCEVSLLSVTGNDPESDKMKGLLESEGIKHYLVEDKERPTTLKTRVMNGPDHKLRVDFESTQDISEAIEQKVLELFSVVLKENRIDILILQDYNKGLLTSTLIPHLIEKAKSHQVFIAVDPKFKNFKTYQDVDVFKPNRKEAAEALGRSSEELDDLKNDMIDLQDQLNSRFVVLTLSEMGVMLIDENHEIVHVPTEPIDAVDVCGAGDAVLSVISLLLESGCQLDEVGRWTNRIGSQICMVPGVGTIEL